MNLRSIKKLTLSRSKVKLIDSYSSLDIPLLYKATFLSCMLIGGTATQLLAKAYNVRERRTRSINDLDFLTTHENSENVQMFEKFLLSQGFTKSSASEYMINYSNSEVGCDVDILISWEPEVMKRAIKVNGVLVQHPCWQFTQKLQRIVTGFGSKKNTDIQDLNTLYDVIVARGEIEKLQEIISEEVPNIDEDELNSFLQE